MHRRVKKSTNGRNNVLRFISCLILIYKLLKQQKFKFEYLFFLKSLYLRNKEILTIVW